MVRRHQPRTSTSLVSFARPPDEGRQGGEMKIFGREPTLWIAVISSLVILIGTFGLRFINGDQAALMVVVINAAFGALNAYTVRPISPVAFTYFIGSLVALGASYGLNLPAET